MYPDICICICICICVRIRLEFPSFYADAVHTSLGINLYLFREHNNPKVKNQKQQRATGIHESKKHKNERIRRRLYLTVFVCVSVHWKQRLRSTKDMDKQWAKNSKRWWRSSIRYRGHIVSHRSIWDIRDGAKCSQCVRVSRRRIWLWLHCSCCRLHHRCISNELPRPSWPEQIGLREWKIVSPQKQMQIYLDTDTFAHTIAVCNLLAFVWRIHWCMFKNRCRQVPKSVRYKCIYYLSVPLPRRISHILWP